jgi:NADH:ubiquinone oxidoreductase subunit C
MANTIPTAVTARSVRDVLARRLGRFPAVSGPADELSVTVAGDELHAVIEELRALGARHVMMLGLEVRQVRSRAGRVVEEVVAIPNGPVVRVRVDVPDSRAAYPSLTPLVPAAQWDEREIHDVFDIVPTGHPDLRPLLVHEAPGGGTAMPYRHFVAHGDGVYQLPVGPIHAGIIEPGHFRFSAVGESILHLDARLFYTHRGLERLVEGRTFDAALAVVQPSHRAPHRDGRLTPSADGARSSGRTRAVL